MHPRPPGLPMPPDLLRVSVRVLRLRLQQAARREPLALPLAYFERRQYQAERPDRAG